jgi:hypothetical protein
MTKKNNDCICQELSWHKTGLEIGYETECKNKAKFLVTHNNPIRKHLPKIEKVVCGTHVKYYRRNPLGIFDNLNLVIEPIDSDG